MKNAMIVASTIVTLSAGGAWAENLCGFTASQLNRGFTETVDKSTINISRAIGNGSRCQDATITTTVVTCINQAGNVMDTRSFTTEPVESDWGPSYSAPCTY